MLEGEAVKGVGQLDQMEDIYASEEGGDSERRADRLGSGKLGVRISRNMGCREAGTG